MRYRIEVPDPSKIARRMEKVWESAVLPTLSQDIKNDCNVYVRMQSGDLARSADIEDGGKKVTWNTPYAKKVYYTGTPRININPSASLRWCEKAIRRFKSDWVARANSLLKG